MSFNNEINNAHDLVVRCNKIDMPHKMEAHTAIDRIEAAHKEETTAKDATIARLTEALKQIAMRPATDFVSEFEANVATALAALAAEGGAK